MPRPKKEPVSLRVPVPMMDQVRRITIENNVAITDVIIAALNYYLTQHGEGKKEV